jgi:hypothetical protein
MIVQPVHGLAMFWTIWLVIAPALSWSCGSPLPAGIVYGP